ncbi:hypothetical protein ACA910_001008 [Epithemia clementina (nom. ined.)]
MTAIPSAVRYGFLTFVALPVAAVLNRFIQWIVSPLRKLPGPKERCLPLGCFLEMIREPKYEPQLRWWREAGYQEALIHFTVLFWRQHLLILDKEIVKTILTSSYGKDSPRFTKRVQALKDTVGNGLVTVQGPEWARHRHILQPAFNTRFLKESMTLAVPFRVKRFIECWKPAAADNRRWEIDVASHMAAITLDIVGDVAFSHQFNALDTIEEWSKQAQQMDNGVNELKLADVSDNLLSYFAKLVGSNVLTILCMVLNLEKLNWYINSRLRETRYFLDREVDKIVDKARKESTKSQSVLHLLLHARDPEVESEVGSLSDADLRDEVKTFMIAGYETTSSWLHWALFALVKYPDIQERVYAEVVKHASVDKNEDISLDQIDKMEYFGAFLQEVLRVYPPIGTFIRYNAYQEKWNGVTVPPDTRLFLSPHIMHRHPEYWDEPESFMPERWIDVSVEEAERRRFAFIPFSAGGRNCIGQQFATMEVKLILAPLIRAFKFLKAPSQRETEFNYNVWSIALKPNPVFKISLQNR